MSEMEQEKDGASPLRGRAGGAIAPEPLARLGPDGRSSLTQVTELQMTPISEGLPQRDELLGEQTILTYCEPAGTWDLAFYEAGWEMDDGFKLGVTHWVDISEMWPGVTAQVTACWREKPRVSDENTKCEDRDSGLRSEGLPARCHEVADAQLSSSKARIETLEEALSFVESWIANPVSSYSVAVLDGLFGMTRDRLAALRSKGETGDAA